MHIARYGTFFLMDGDGGERQMGANPVENLYQLLGQLPQPTPFWHI